MKLAEIKEIAVLNGVIVGKMKKCEIIRAIQIAEGNIPCFESGIAEKCGQASCLWRADCR